MAIYEDSISLYVARRLLIITEFFRVDTMGTARKGRCLRMNYMKNERLISSWASLFFDNFYSGTRYHK